MRIRYLPPALLLAGALAASGALAQAAAPEANESGKACYVATTGDDGNPGTKDQPFKTIQKAVGAVKAGDTIVFRAGRYPPFEVRNLSGTPEAWITFRAQRGERVTIDRYLESRKDVGACIHIIGVCSYLVFDGFEITNTHPQIDQIRLLNVEKPDDLAKFVAYLKPSKEGPGDIFNTGVRINPPSKPPSHHHLIFRNLEVHHLIGMAFSGVGNDWQFLDNHVYDLGRPRSGYGWYTHGDRHVYRGNVVHDSIFGFHLYSGSGETRLRDSIVENNIVYNNGLWRYWHMTTHKVNSGGSGILVSPGENNIIRNNIVVNNGGGITANSNNSKLLNNTVFGNKTGISTGNATTVTIQNNILFANGKAIVGEGHTLSNNLVDRDPLFVNAEARDFHLKAGSPAIDAGAALKEVAADKDGVARPQGAAYDIGAYEFKGAK